MSARFPAVLLASAAFSLYAVAGEIPSLSGAWTLNVEKSRWGNKPKPKSVVVHIEHNEPALKYQGTVVDATGESRDFSLEGMIDGKPYPIVADYGEGLVTIRRLNDTTIRSEFRTHDGRYVETARTSISSDGRTLTRRIRLRGPDGSRSWTEVYEKH